MSNQTQQQQLEAEFPPEMLDSVPKQGRNLTYVPVGEVIQRLNDVLGPSGWEWKVERIWRDQLDPDWVLAYGHMTATVDGVTSTRSGAGGVFVKRTKKDATIVDLGDEFKGADSDALKKAAQRFGVGLWLGRSKEARQYEAPTPVRDPIAEGWESAERAMQFVTDLKARITAAPAEVRSDLKDFQTAKQLVWPPTYDGYELMRRQLDKLLHEWEVEQKRIYQEAGEVNGTGRPLPAHTHSNEVNNPGHEHGQSTRGESVEHGSALDNVSHPSNKSMPLNRDDELALAQAGVPASELGESDDYVPNDGWLARPQSPETVSPLPSPSETQNGPDGATGGPDGARDEGRGAVANAVSRAFPGAVDESPASAELLDVVDRYLDNISEHQGSVRAWNKYAKEKGYPKDRREWTHAQATEAADFIEGL